jgi:hypothetical protein
VTKKILENFAKNTWRILKAERDIILPEWKTAHKIKSAKTKDNQTNQKPEKGPSDE